MIITSARKSSQSAALTYLVIGHEAPCEDANFLVKWNLIDTAWQVGAVSVNNVLEVLAEAHVKRLQIDLALHDLQQPVELVDSQVLNDSLRHSCDLLLRRRLGQSLIDKVSVDLLQGRMTPVDQVA